MKMFYICFLTFGRGLKIIPIGLAAPVVWYGDHGFGAVYLLYQDGTPLHKVFIRKIHMIVISWSHAKRQLEIMVKRV